MSYFIIDKQPVFLSWARDQELADEAFKDKNALFRVSSSISGNRECKEASKLKYLALKAKRDKDPKGFYEYWARFDLIGQEAAENVQELLHDYCHLYGYAYLSDLRDPITKLAEDMTGDDYLYPVGRTFLLNHFVSPSRWWWKYTHGMNGRTVSIRITTERVTRLVGDLSDFTLLTRGVRINCGRNFEIIPV